MWEQYPDINHKIGAVEEIIQKNLKSRNKALEALLKNLSNAGGKRLRPGFVILSSGFGKVKDDSILTAAAGIEILHMATLVHDDVIDDAGVRRGKPTINYLHGDKMAVYAGDYLLTRAVLLLSKVLPEQRLEQITKGVKSICEAEAEQYYNRYKTDVSLVTYLKRIGRKTSMLFLFSCAEGAFLSRCPQKYQRNLVKFGYYYGMAFQIMDDILDITGDIEKTGKPKGNDIKDGVITLPFISALNKSPDFAQTVNCMLSRKMVGDKEISWIIKEIERLGGIRDAKMWIARYLDKARRMLEPLPEKTEKRVLLDLAAQLEQ